MRWWNQLSEPTRKLLIQHAGAIEFPGNLPQPTHWVPTWESMQPRQHAFLALAYLKLREELGTPLREDPTP